MTPEGQVKQEVKEILNGYRPLCWYFCPVPFGYGPRGIPDFIGCFNGRFFTIETKALRKNLSPWQERITMLIRQSMGKAFVFAPNYNIDNFKREWIIWTGLNG